MVRGYEPGREDHEFEPRLGNFFLVKVNLVNSWGDGRDVGENNPSYP